MNHTFYRSIFYFLFFIFISSSLNADNINSRYLSVSLNFDKPLSEKLKKYYYSLGVESIVLVSDTKYLFYAKREVISELYHDQKILEINNLNISDKIQKDFLKKIKKNAETITLKILLFKAFDKNELFTIFTNIKAKIENISNSGKIVTIELPIKYLDDLLALPQVQYVEKNPKKLEIKSHHLYFSHIAAKLSEADILWGSPYLLSGKGINVAVIDEGKVRTTHQEFIENGQSRIKISENSGYLSAHATHVAGIIASKGINQDAHGMASNVNVYSYYFNDFSFANAMIKAYEDANVLLSNHSYGYSFNVFKGEYNLDAMAIDETVYNNPFLNAFIASGNDRDRYGYDKYGITKGPVNAKNILTIGAVDDYGEALASFSSTGPTLDGRIKPELVANGTLLYSTGIKSDSDYFSLSGTSMATPVATGVAALMMEEYLKSTHKNIRHDLLKAILINTAIDKGKIGPDYEYGFGLIDAKAAVDLIKTLKNDNQYIINDDISDNESKSYCIDNSTDKDLKTTIAWIDPAGNPINQDRILVNDIDISITTDNNYTIYPFSLDKQNPALPATADKPNNVDNIEQIVLATKQRGVILHLTGAHIVTNKQQFALVSNKQFVKLPLLPTNIKAKSINNHTIQLSWENNNTNIDKELQIFRNDKLINTIKADEKKFLDNKLQPNTIYKYKIAIADLCGRKMYSKEISIKTPHKIKRPSNLQIKLLGIDKILLQWKDNSCNEKGFYIYRDGCLIATLSKNSTSFLDYGIKTNKKHTYEIVAFNSTEYSCPLKRENNLFENKVINYPLKNYYFSLKKCQPFDINIIAPGEKEPLVTIISISTGKEYKFCTFCTIDKNKRGYYIKYVNSGMLPAGDYEIIISNQDIKDLKIYSNILLYTSRLHNYSRIVYQHIMLE